MRVEQQAALWGRQLTTAKRTYQKLSRVCNRKTKWSQEKNDLSGSAMKGAANYYTMATWPGCICYGLMQG